MLSELVLLPRPRRVSNGEGVCLGDDFVSRRDATLPAQGYRLAIGRDGVRVDFGDEAGAHYAAMSLRQLRRVARVLPCGTIEDWPDFATRGVMIDISRDKVPRMETLRRLVDELSEWKVNRLELYTEHTFAFRNHREVWQYADPMTAEEVRELDGYCRARFVELVPNQNCFGHLARWLKHPRYRDLAEAPEGHTAWGAWRNYPFSLNPLDPRSIGLVEELLAELLPNFSSGNVNVGCDETVDLGQGRSKSECERIGKGRVYLDFLLKIYGLTKRFRRRMHFWGDIILHHPELIPELPKDAVAMVWGYEADHPFAKECAAFAESGLPFLVCPGTSSWNAVTGRTENMLGNIRAAVQSALACGASGVVTTDWGDNGHWQPLAFSYPGFAAGAAFSWCQTSNGDEGLAAQLDAHVFCDSSGVAGGAVLELGNVYRKLSSQRANGSHLFWILRDDDISAVLQKVSAAELSVVRDAICEAVGPLANARLNRDDADAIRNEIAIGAWMLDLACRRGLNGGREARDLERLIESMRSSWLRRNRPGGLDDSLKPLIDRARRSP